MTAEQVHWIKIAEAQLDSLPKLGEVLDHWRRTGANIKTISARDTVEFINWKLASTSLKPRTVGEIRTHLQKFGKYFGATPFIQITADKIDGFLLTRNEGGDRRSFWKRMKPMVAYRVIRNWIAVNPLEGTRRAEGDERFIPLTKGGSLYTWLVQKMDGENLTWRIIQISDTQLRERMQAIFQLAFGDIGISAKKEVSRRKRGHS